MARVLDEKGLRDCAAADGLFREERRSFRLDFGARPAGCGRAEMVREGKLRRHS